MYWSGFVPRWKQPGVAITKRSSMQRCVSTSSSNVNHWRRRSGGWSARNCAVVHRDTGCVLASVLDLRHFHCVRPASSFAQTNHATRVQRIIERDGEDYYVATVPALRGCHTQTGSLDELMDRVPEAISLCLEVEGAEAEPLDFVGVQHISIAV